MTGRCTKHGVVRISHTQSQDTCHLPDAMSRYDTFLVEWAAGGRRARPHMNAPQGGATCGRVLSWTEEST